MAEMSFQDAVRTVFSKYVDFSGRARRAEYWWFALFNVIVLAILSAIQAALFHSPMGNVGILTGIYQLGTLLPSLGVGVRRLHDVGRSGWWWLIAFIPIVGLLVLLYWAVSKGTDGPNEYGPDPVA